MATPFGSYDAQKHASWREFFHAPVAGISYEDLSGTVDRNPSWAVKLTFSIPVAAFKSCDGGAWNFVNH